MFRTDVKSYEILVNKSNANATIICITYRISEQHPYYGAEFRLLVTSFPPAVLPMPEGRAFTFQEEILLLWRGDLVAPVNRMDMSGWLTEKMKLVFGNVINVTVREYTNTAATASIN